MSFKFGFHSKTLSNRLIVHASALGWIDIVYSFLSCFADILILFSITFSSIA